MRKAAVAVVAAAALMAKANAGDDFGYHMADGSSSAAQPVQANPISMGYTESNDATRVAPKDVSVAAAPVSSAKYAHDGGVYDAWLAKQTEKSKHRVAQPRFQQVQAAAMEAEDTDETKEEKKKETEGAPKEEAAATGGATGAATGATGAATAAADPVADAQSHVATTLAHKVRAHEKLEEHKQKIKEAFSRIHANAKEAHENGPESDGVLDQMKKAKEAIEEAKKLRAELAGKNLALEQATKAHRQALKAFTLLKGQRENQASFAECEAKAAAHHKMCVDLVKAGKECPPLEPCGPAEEAPVGPATPSPKNGTVAVRERGDGVPVQAPLTGKKKIMQELGERLLKMSLPLGERRTVQTLESKYLLAKKERERMQGKVDKLEQDLDLLRNRTVAKEEGEKDKEAEEGPSGKMLSYVRNEINTMAAEMKKVTKKVVKLATKKTPGFRIPKKEKKRKEDEDDTPKPPAAAGNDPTVGEKSGFGSGEGEGSAAGKSDDAASGPSDCGKNGCGVKPQTVGNIHDPALKSKDAGDGPSVIPAVVDKVPSAEPQGDGCKKKKPAGDGSGSASPCGPGEHPALPEGAVPNSQTAGPYTLGKSVYPHEPIDPTSPGQRSVADQVFDALGGDKVFGAAMKGESLEQDPKKLHTDVGFGESADAKAPKDATNGLVSGRDETAENMKLLEVGSGPKLKDGKHGFSNMGPEEERVARFELLAESTHLRAEEARLKWMEGRQLASVLEHQLDSTKLEEQGQAKIVDEKIKMKQTNAAAVVNDHGKLHAARQALAAKPEDLTLKAIVQRLEAAEVARGTIEKHDEQDQEMAQKDEQKTLAQVHGREDQLKEQKKKVEALKVQFGVWNKKAQQAAQDAAEARAKFKIRHDVNDLVQREKSQNVDSERVDRLSKGAAGKHEPSAIQKELMKVGTTFSDAVAHRLGGSAGIPVPMHAPQTVSKEQMGAAVGAAIGASRGAQIGANKGAGEAALTMSNAGSFLEVGSRKPLGAMALKALEIAKAEQDAAHAAFTGDTSMAPMSTTERVALDDATRDAEATASAPRFKATSESTMKMNAHGLLQTSVSSGMSANKALRRAQILRLHAQKLWKNTPAAREFPSTLSSSSRAAPLVGMANAGNENTLFTGLPQLHTVSSPLFMETAHWLKNQKLGTADMAPPAPIGNPSRMRFRQVPFANPMNSPYSPGASYANYASAIVGTKQDLDAALSAPLPDLNVI